MDPGSSIDLQISSGESKPILSTLSSELPLHMHGFLDPKSSFHLGNTARRQYSIHRKALRWFFDFLLNRTPADYPIILKAAKLPLDDGGPNPRFNDDEKRARLRSKIAIQSDVQRLASMPYGLEKCSFQEYHEGEISDEFKTRIKKKCTEDAIKYHRAYYIEPNNPLITQRGVLMRAYDRGIYGGYKNQK
jgi:hypothetical protein